jgi:hypothetical protein
MSPRKPPTPEELWKELEDEARGQEAIDRIVALPREELEKELEKAGFDVAQVKAEARAMRDEIARSAAARRAKLKAAEHRRAGPATQGTPVRRLRLAFAIAAAATLAAAAGGGTLYAWLVHRGNGPGPHAPSVPAPPASPEPSVSDQPPALSPSELRRAAFPYCEQERWKECLDILDRAAQMDPAGDADPDVQAARQKAQWGLSHPRTNPLK